MSGLFGVINRAGIDEGTANTAYYGIFSLQHRGQEAAGIAINNNGSFLVHKRDGMVADIFDEITLNALSGNCAIAHARGADGIVGPDGIQPVVIKSRVGNIALSCDSVILNAEQIREELKNQGAIFQTSTDTELILSLFSRNRVVTETTEEALLKTMKELKGVYALIIMTDNKLIGVRDPYGIRPLSLGKKGNEWMLASENCSFDALDAEYVRNLEPGEILSISNEEVSSVFYNDSISSEERIKNGKVCIFEYVYVARPDSVIDGTNVFKSRYEAGKALAKLHPCDCDLVIGAPDSGNAAALGFADGLGVTYGMGLLKNRYVGRTFIKSTQEQRELAVRMKFAVLKEAIKGKRIAIVDDSLVRGTTTKHIIRFLKDNGASEVHVRLASPEVKFPCCYGVNASSDKDLPATRMTVDEIGEMIGADSLGYISLECLKEALGGLICDTCSACFDGNYVAGKSEEFEKSVHQVTNL